MAQDSFQERTEQPTPKRLQEARDKGQVPRSRELTTLAVLLAGGSALISIGPSMINGMGEIMRRGFVISRTTLFDNSAGVRMFGEAVLEMIWVIAPFLIITIIAAVVAPIALGGWNFSGKALAFNWSKLDPVKGLGRMFSSRGGIELLKALAKFVVVFGGGILLLSGLEDRFLALGVEPLEKGLVHAGYLLGWAFLLLSATLIVVVMVDVPFQLWDHSRQLKMTRQEIKDEMKETEGKPEVRGRIRRLQQAAAQRRMMADVPEADVIITNPEHYAIALKYEHGVMSVPRVVAKGADLVAAEIRRIGGESGVLQVAAPPLARAIYYSVEIGEEIPEGLFLAVARVLAYVFSWREWMHNRRTSEKPVPPRESELPIPNELRRDS